MENNTPKVAENRVREFAEKAANSIYNTISASIHHRGLTFKTGALPFEKHLDSLAHIILNQAIEILNGNIDIATMKWTEISIEKFNRLQKVNEHLFNRLDALEKRMNDHLHAISDHQSLLVYQQARRIQDDPSHVNHNLFIHAPAPKRRLMKQTLSDKTVPYLMDLDSRLQKRATPGDIHTDVVTSTRHSYGVSVILGGYPPPVHSSEASLPRKTRCTLAQLRSGYSPYLATFLHKINPLSTPSPVCPTCHAADHTTNHLFVCRSKPTHLDVSSLWLRPREAAEFLGLSTENDGNASAAAV